MSKMNKGYINFFFSLLSVFIYVNDKTLATEPSPDNATLDKFVSALPNDESDKGHEQNNPLLCTDPEETEKATKLMNIAVSLLQYHGTNTDNYDLITDLDFDTNLYFKKHETADIEKLNFKIRNPDKYNDIVNKLWNPHGDKYYDENFINGKIVRVYNPNLIMIQQHYRNPTQSSPKHAYALATKVEISKDTTIMVCGSTNINGHNNSSQKTYINTISEIANSLKIDIDSEEGIKKEELEKKFVNLSGFIIKKDDELIDITYVSSMHVNAPFVPMFINRLIKASKLIVLMHLKNVFYNV
ncbi:fam-a protein [Plasmodium vinckei brucechwatti]|uniref:Fam-a protein n=1 Tax=Plasmodium vinckei brucechwatti TaxID=119398 RepID=A0A6V7RXX5_PLAVN|nr:fam-a protein [Plasmodium vinckei brucechwatti]